MADPNDSGRALEFAVVTALVEHATVKGIRVELSNDTISDNKRDSAYYNSLTTLEKKDFKTFSKTFLKWADEQKWFEGSDHLMIERFSDAKGTAGDVTDIHLTFLCKGDVISELSISLKNHHNALKHPRLPRLPEQCGIRDKEVSNQYLRKHDTIWNDFLTVARKTMPTATEFNQLKKNDEQFIDVNLYKPLMTHVASFLQEHSTDLHCARSFFTFLVGSSHDYVVKNETKYIIIKHFDSSEIKEPTAFEVTYPFEGKASTLLLEFNNGWKLKARLHTASSAFIKQNKLNASVKFDVECINLEEVIKTERLPKT